MESISSQVDEAMEREGLWPFLLRHAPPPEHREMELVIGSQRLARNKNLWVEVNALREILSDVSGFAQGRLATPDRQALLGAGSGGEFEALVRTVRSLLTEIIKKHPEGREVSLSAVQDFAIEIQRSLDCERDYLSSEIKALNYAIDAEAESMCERSCTVASQHSLDSHLSIDIKEGYFSNSSMTSSRKPKGKFRSRLPFKTELTGSWSHQGAGNVGKLVTADQSSIISTEGEEAEEMRSEAISSRKSGTSKFRNRLQAAKDENYFIDEFELGMS